MAESLINYIYFADLLGVAVFAISGALAAGTKSLDWLGVIVISTVTAIGGGTLRDLLLDRHPVFWIENPIYIYIIVLSAGLTLLYSRYRVPPFKALLIADAFGLALFAILGASIAHNLDLKWPIVIIMGTMTGVAGGVIRDIISNEIPLILRRDFYATAAILGISIYLILLKINIDELYALMLSMSVIALLRLLAIFKNLRLPVFQIERGPY